MDAPSLEGQVGWSNLVKWKGSLSMAGDWNEMIFNVPSNPNYSVSYSPQCVLLLVLFEVYILPKCTIFQFKGIPPFPIKN